MLSSSKFCIYEISENCFSGSKYYLNIPSLQLKLLGILIRHFSLVYWVYMDGNYRDLTANS